MSGLNNLFGEKTTNLHCTFSFHKQQNFFLGVMQRLPQLPSIVLRQPTQWLLVNRMRVLRIVSVLFVRIASIQMFDAM